MEMPGKNRKPIIRRTILLAVIGLCLFCACDKSNCMYAEYKMLSDAIDNGSHLINALRAKSLHKEFGYPDDSAQEMNKFLKQMQSETADTQKSTPTPTPKFNPADTKTDITSNSGQGDSGSSGGGGGGGGACADGQ
jgi:hypothetical protein